MVTNDNNGHTEIKAFKYSGGVGAIPLIFNRNYVTYQWLQGQPGHQGIADDCSYLQINIQQISSNSKINLSANQANGVTYHNVEVWHGDYAENGKEKMSFNITPDAYGGIQTFCPPTSFEHRNGLLLSNEQVDQAGNTVYKEKNQYAFSYDLADTSQYKIVDGVTQMAMSTLPCMMDLPMATADGTNTYDSSSPCYGLIPGEQMFDHAQKFYVNLYHVISEKVQKTATTQYHYGRNGLFLDSIVTNYTYPASLHNQVIAEQYTNSKNEPVKTSYNYPFEMVSSGRDPNHVYQAMINQNLVSPVIEAIEQKNNIQTKLIRTNYWQPYANILVPQNVEIQSLSTLPTESRVRYDSYDILGNVLSVEKELGPKTVYIWGYGGQYPVAEIHNADYSTVETALGGSAAVSAFRNNLKPSATDVKNFLAALRTNTALKSSLVTTYTYLPLVGITSMTDPKGETTTYEYDSFQRLMNIKDKDGNIIKHIDYNYQH